MGNKPKDYTSLANYVISQLDADDIEKMSYDELLQQMYNDIMSKDDHMKKVLTSMNFKASKEVYNIVHDPTSTEGVTNLKNIKSDTEIIYEGTTEADTDDEGVAYETIVEVQRRDGVRDILQVEKGKFTKEDKKAFVNQFRSNRPFRRKSKEEKEYISEKRYENTMNKYDDRMLSPEGDFKRSELVKHISETTGKNYKTVYRDTTPLIKKGKWVKVGWGKYRHAKELRYTKV